MRVLAECRRLVQVKIVHMTMTLFGRFKQSASAAGRRRRLLERRAASMRRAEKLETVRRWREWCIARLRARALLSRAGIVVSRNATASIEHR